MSTFGPLTTRKTLNCWSVSKKDSGAQVLWAAAEGGGFFSLEKRKLTGDLTALYNCQVGVSLLSLVASDRTRGNGLNMCERRLDQVLDKLLHEKGYQASDQLPSIKVVVSRSIEVFRICVGENICGFGAWGHGLVMELAVLGLWLDLMILKVLSKINDVKGPFQNKQFCDSMCPPQKLT